MHILITGAAGFIGQLVAQHLLAHTSHFVTLVDIVHPPVPTGTKHPQNVQTIKADLCDAAAIRSIVSTDINAVFAFHGIMSSGSEADFDHGMRSNIDATRSLLDALRTHCPGVRFIYASGGAVYGQPLPAIVDETVAPTPQSSYGAEKLVCEILVNEYSRRKFVDGLSLRFPTISIRPGKPTAAASSFLSGMIREPLDGKVCDIPIEDRGFESWISSPRIILENLMHALTVDTSAMAPHIRQINMPGICVTIQEMMDALEKVGGKDRLALLREKEDPDLGAILRSWPTRFDNTAALKFGFKRDESFERFVADYVDSLNAI